jgi:hypothetical protein
MGTMVTLFLLLHPSLSSHLSPGRNGTEYYLFAHRDGEIVDKFAREIFTLMASLDAFLFGTRPDGTDLTVFE